MQKCLMILCCIITAFAAQANPERIIVSQDGKGQFTTIQAALNSLPSKGNEPVIIFIRKGTYKEKLYINTAQRKGTDEFYRVPKELCIFVPNQEFIG